MGSGKMEKEMVMVFKSGLMGLNSKAIGKTIECMEKVSLSMPTAIPLKENGQKIVQMDLVFT